MEKILVVDDNPDNLAIVGSILKGLYAVYRISSAKTALRFLETHCPDLILLDVQMPEMSGYDLIKKMKADEKLKDIPVIFLTALHDTRSEADAFEFGAVDYIHKPFNNVVIKARVKLHLEMEAYRRNLQELVTIKTSQLTELQKITMDLLAHINELRDHETGGHVQRTADYVCAIMDNLYKMDLDGYSISETYYEDIKNSTPLHDIGKICVPDSILLKPDSLTSDEFEIMKEHVVKGGELLQDVIDKSSGPSFLDVAKELVMSHHEKWDGSGYPFGISGKDIPLSGRIMAIADVFDALTSKRPYKYAYSREAAIEMIKKESGTHFDPVLVDVFINSQDDVKKILARHGGT